jgi:hypothetical protein
MKPNETYVRHATSWGRLVINGQLLSAYLFLRIRGFLLEKITERLLVILITT